MTDHEATTNRTCVVFGAASGIGYGIATRFLKDGAHVVVADTQEATFSFERDRWRSIRCDVSREDDVAAAIEAADEFRGYKRPREFRGYNG